MKTQKTLLTISILCLGAGIYTMRENRPGLTGLFWGVGAVVAFVYFKMSEL